MSMNDPLGDMLTRIRNAQMRGKSTVRTPASKLRAWVLDVLKDEGSPVKVLVVSMYPEDQYAIRALRAGAYGYVNKGGDPQILVQAVRTVAQGRKYVTPEIAQMLVESLTTPAVENPHQKLSDRELQTLVMIASGKRLADIAEELMLSPKTVSAPEPIRSIRGSARSFPYIANKVSGSCLSPGITCPPLRPEPPQPGVLASRTQAWMPRSARCSAVDPE